VSGRVFFRAKGRLLGRTASRLCLLAAALRDISCVMGLILASIAVTNGITAIKQVFGLG
jgi:hypothetical protein